MLVWTAVLGAILGVGLGAEASGDDELSMPEIESQRASDLIEERFPDASTDGASATLVFVAPEGQAVGTGTYGAAGSDALASLKDSPRSPRWTNPAPSAPRAWTGRRPTRRSPTP